MATCDDYLFEDRAKPLTRPWIVRAVAAIGHVASKALWQWPERARQRRQLARMDDRMLSDLGLSRSDVDAEFRKAPWRD